MLENGISTKNSSHINAENNRLRGLQRQWCKKKEKTAC